MRKALKEIVRHNLDDTFYVVDLANVLRMYKVSTTSSLAALCCAFMPSKFAPAKVATLRS